MLDKYIPVWYNFNMSTNDRNSVLMFPRVIVKDYRLGRQTPETSLSKPSASNKVSGVFLFTNIPVVEWYPEMKRPCCCLGREAIVVSVPLNSVPSCRPTAHWNSFTISQADTQPCAVQHKPVNRCLTAFHRKQKNVVQLKVLAPGTPTPSDLSGCTSNVAGSHQSGRVSHFHYLLLAGLELMHGENHNKQSLWNYEYPALTGLRDFALSYN